MSHNTSSPTLGSKVSLQQEVVQGLGGKVDPLSQTTTSTPGLPDTLRSPCSCLNPVSFPHFYNEALPCSSAEDSGTAKALSDFFSCSFVVDIIFGGSPGDTQGLLWLCT